jgi:hypothetical protein
MGEGDHAPLWLRGQFKAACNLTPNTVPYLATGAK